MNTQAIDISDAIPIYRFPSGDGFRRDDKYYKHVRTTKDHQILRRADNGIEERYPHEIIHAWLNDKVRPLEHLPGFYADGGGVIEEELGNLFLGDLPESKQKSTDRKITVCERFLAREAETAHLIPTLNDADSRDSQKATNLNRWRKQEVCDGFGDFVAVRL